MSQPSLSQQKVRSAFKKSCRCYNAQPYTGGATPPDIGPRNRSWWYNAAGGSGLWYYDYFMQQSLNKYLQYSVPNWCLTPLNAWAFINNIYKAGTDCESSWSATVAGAMDYYNDHAPQIAGSRNAGIKISAMHRSESDPPYYCLHFTHTKILLEIHFNEFPTQEYFCVKLEIAAGGDPKHDIPMSFGMYHTCCFIQNPTAAWNHIGQLIQFLPAFPYVSSGAGMLSTYLYFPTSCLQGYGSVQTYIIEPYALIPENIPGMISPGANKYNLRETYFYCPGSIAGGYIYETY